MGDSAGFRYNQRPSSGSIGYGPISPTVDADSHPNGVLYSIPENAINRPSGGTNGPMAYGGDEPSPTLRASKDQPAVMVDYKQTPKVSENVSHTITHEGSGGIHSAVAFAQNTRDEVRLFGGDGQTVGALSAQPGMKQTSYIMTQYGDVAGTLNARGDSSPCADRGQNVVCMQDGQAKGTIADDVSTTLNASHEQPIVIYRAAFNQGENARFDPHVEEGG